jgi:hypothetical protein
MTIRLASVLALALTAGVLHAQSYPARPVKVVVPAAAGSATDTVARVFGRRLGDLLGQPFVVENRAGKRRDRKRLRGQSRRRTAASLSGQTQRGDPHDHAPCPIPFGLHSSILLGVLPGGVGIG